MQLTNPVGSMSKTFYRGLLLAYAVSVASGLLFFILNTWVTVEGDFGPQKHPWQYSTLKLHGAAAFAMMLFFGALLNHHIPQNWKGHAARRSGQAMTLIVSLQIVTAWLLYYLADETIRQWIVYLHLSAGLTLPLLLIVHIVSRPLPRKLTPH
ncbi:MAG TPA: hypothetical protein DCF45_08235 [Gammaproteobacteria bacterium]|nr:hypothetical protein [Gammaproteobacteria bacterium]